jgi:hypothetical protein
MAARVSAVVAVLVAELEVLLVVRVGVDLEGEVGQVDGGVGAAEAAGAGVGGGVRMNQRECRWSEIGCTFVGCDAGSGRCATRAAAGVSATACAGGRR